MTLTATYSPEDNKLRLYASQRLDAETYARVKEAGFIWAPRQQLFVAPMWTPAREDLLTELCSEIGDEDTSLVDRAEERADRFQDYSANRLQDAESAHAAVERITDGIPFGQPILVGHHSERRARKDAERIENGMRKAVKMWETSKYWKSRAAGAIRHAKYKERPDVRQRRIKGLESDIRVYRAKFTPDPKTRPQIWDGEEHVYCKPANGGGRGGSWVKTSQLPGLEAYYSRLIQHCEFRLEYERAMLGESGGLATDKFDIRVGGRICRRGQWFVVSKLNKKDGALRSVSVLGHWCSTVQAEEISDYQPPEEGTAEKVKTVTKQKTLVNFRAPGCKEMTTAEWKQRCKYSDSYYVGEFTIDGEYTSKWADDRKTAAYRQRTMSAGGSLNYTRVPVFLTDAKVVEPPNPQLAAVKPEPAPIAPLFAPVMDERPVYRAPEPTKFDALRESLKAGVQTVSAPQLFPTPPEIARKLVSYAGIESGMRVLEPSAGTGNIMRAVGLARVDCTGVAIELNHHLANSLSAMFMTWDVRQADFLMCNGDLGQFDAIVMNPPFRNAIDIEHIEHAFTMLKPGARLAAVCANGPRQRERFQAIAEHWEDLPPGTFEESGTGVNTAIVVLRKDA